MDTVEGAAAAAVDEVELEMNAALGDEPVSEVGRLEDVAETEDWTLDRRLWQSPVSLSFSDDEPAGVVTESTSC